MAVFLRWGTSLPGLTSLEYSHFYLEIILAKISEVQVGTVIGRLTITALKRVPYTRKGGTVVHRPTAVCDCSCGTKGKEILVESLGTLVQACGCLGAERRRASTLTHGRSQAKDKLYIAWSAMKQRTMYDRGQFFYLYGGRGITASENFLGPNGFENFAKEVGEPPTEKHSLDRINPEKGYVEGNLRWATAKEQARNKRNNFWVNYQGERITFAEAAERSGVGDRKARDRYTKLGWTLSEAFETENVTEYNEPHE